MRMVLTTGQTTGTVTSRLAPCPISTPSTTSWSVVSAHEGSLGTSDNTTDDDALFSKHDGLTARGHELYAERGLLR